MTPEGNDPLTGTVQSLEHRRFAREWSVSQFAEQPQAEDRGPATRSLGKEALTDVSESIEISPTQMGHTLDYM